MKNISVGGGDESERRPGRGKRHARRISRREWNRCACVIAVLIVCAVTAALIRPAIALTVENAGYSADSTINNEGDIASTAVTTATAVDFVPSDDAAVVTAEDDYDMEDTAVDTEEDSDDAASDPDEDSDVASDSDEDDGVIYYCGLEEHEHSEEEGCYEKQLICGYEDDGTETDDEDEADSESESGTSGSDSSDSDASDDDGDSSDSAGDDSDDSEADASLDDAGTVTVTHTHSDSCYETQEVLICGLSETEGHTHSESCYGTALICDEEESEGHTHSDSCYSRSLSCGQSESDGHTHSDSCRDADGALICGEEESEGHTHTDTCYTETLSCGLSETEGHIHSDSCYGETLICDQEETESHTHTDSCYETQQILICGYEEGEIVTSKAAGKTASEGSSDSDESSGSSSSSDSADSTDSDSDTGSESDSTSSSNTDTGSESDSTSSSDADAASESDSTSSSDTDTGSDSEESHTHTDECYELVLICEQEEHTHTAECLIPVGIAQTLTASWDIYTVTVTVDETAGIPEGAELQVSESEVLSSEEEILEEIYGEAYLVSLEEGTEKIVDTVESLKTGGISNVRTVEQTEYSVESYIRLSISILLDGEEVEPAEGSAVDVSICVAGGISLGEDEELSVIHFEEEETSEIVDEIELSDAGEESEIAFTTDSFSDYGIAVVSVVDNDSNTAMLVVGETATIYLTELLDDYDYYSDLTVTVTNTDETDTTEYATASMRNGTSSGTVDGSTVYAAGTGDSAATFSITGAAVGTTTVVVSCYPVTLSGSTYAKGTQITVTYTVTVNEFTIDDAYTGKLTITLSENMETLLQNASDVTTAWYKSTDGGTTWTEVAQQIYDLNGESYYSIPSGSTAYDEQYLYILLDGGELSDDQTSVSYYAVITYTESGASSASSITSNTYEVTYYSELQNGDFEATSKDGFTGSNKQYSNEEYIEAEGVWQSTGEVYKNSKDRAIEIVNADNTSSFTSDYSWNGEQVDGEGDDDGDNRFAEINCEAEGALYQDILTLPNTVIDYSLAHRARGSTKSSTAEYDTMYLVIMPTATAMTTGTNGGELDTQEELLSYIKTLNSSFTGSTSYSAEGAEVIYNQDGILIVRITSDDQDWHSIASTDSSTLSVLSGVSGIEYTTSAYLTRVFLISGNTASGNVTVGNFIDAIGMVQETYDITLSVTVNGLPADSLEELQALLSGISFHLSGETDSDTTISSDSAISFDHMTWTQNSDGSWTGTFRLAGSIISAESYANILQFYSVFGYSVYGKDVSTDESTNTSSDGSDLSTLYQTVENTTSICYAFELTYSQNLVVYKVDEEGNGLSGATFTIDSGSLNSDYAAAGTYTTLTSSDTNGQMYNGTYVYSGEVQLSESVTPAGYTPIESVTMDVCYKTDSYGNLVMYLEDTLREITFKTDSNGIVIKYQESSDGSGYVAATDTGVKLYVYDTETDEYIDLDHIVYKTVMVVTVDGKTTTYELDTETNTYTVYIENSLDYDLEIIKVDADGEVLEGASFTLTLTGGELSEDKISDSGLTLSEDGSSYSLTSGSDGGILSLKDIDWTNLSLTLTETRAPTGYKLLSSPISISFEKVVKTVTTSDESTGETVTAEVTRIQAVVDDGSAGGENAVVSVSYSYDDGDSESADTASYTITVTISNGSAYELPESGGGGTGPYTAAGLSLLAGAAAAGGIRRKRRRKERVT